MTIRRIVPNVQVASEEAMKAGGDFYGLLGFEEVMNMGWVVTLASPANPTAQISLFTEERTAPVVSDLSVEVDDVDAVYARGGLGRGDRTGAAGRGVGRTTLLRPGSERAGSECTESPGLATFTDVADVARSGALHP